MKPHTPFSCLILAPEIGPTWPQGRPQQDLNNNFLLLRCFSGYKVVLNRGGLYEIRGFSFVLENEVKIQSLFQSMLELEF